MRFFKFILVSLVILTTSSIELFAAKTVSLFSISQYALRNGKLFVPSPSHTRLFSFAVAVNRSMYSGVYESGNCTVKAVLITGSTEIELPGGTAFTSSDYANGGISAIKYDVLATLPTNVTSGIIRAKLKYYDYSLQDTVTHYSNAIYNMDLAPSSSYTGSVMIENWVSNTLDCHYLAIRGDSPTPSSNYHYESNAFRAYPTQVTGTIPIYRFRGSYPGNTYSFMYSTGISQHPFWAYEGIAFYAFANQVSGSLAVNCYANSQSRNHYFSLHQESDPYWHFQHFAFYAYP